MTSAHFTSARILFSAFIIMAALPAMAQRQPDPEQMEQLKTQMVERFGKTDTNGDGKLTRGETEGKMPRLHKHFAQVDTDGDGYVNQADITAYAENLIAQRR